MRKSSIGRKNSQRTIRRNRRRARHANGVKNGEILNFCADFETTTKLDDCRVWGWGLANIEHPDEVEIEHTIDEFIERISFQDCVVYFHNLKFDGRFILDWLFKNGYEHLEDEDRDVPKMHFRTLISVMGRFYSMKVHFASGVTVEFRDSFNKIPLSISRMAKAFNQAELKGDIDYTAERPIGYRMSEEERDYIRRDVSIAAHGMKETLENGMTKLTVASDALSDYKKLTGKKFNKLFPRLSEELDTIIRRAYRGGFTLADERFRGRRVGSGIVLDVNSLYPSVMKNNLIPYGEPRYQEGKVETTEGWPLAIITVTITARLKADHIPCIQIKGNSVFAPTEYLTEINEPTTLTMTNVDFELYSDHYDIDVLEWGGGWLFKASVGLFDVYIDKWGKLKEESTGGKREIAKLFLNGLYGKFATNPKVTCKVPYLDEDGVVRLRRGPDNTRPPVYTAAGVFITSHARNLTIRAAQANYDVFAYADTDSLHLLIDEIPESIDVHPTRMGAWKFEYAFKEAFYVRSKAYLEKKYDDSFVVRMAGLPEKVSENLTFEDMIDGKVLTGKMVPKAVPGGIVLVDIDYKVKL